MHSHPPLSSDQAAVYLTIVGLLAGAMLTVWLTVYVWCVKCATRALWRGIIQRVRHLVGTKPELSGAYAALVGDTIAAALLRGTVILSAAPFVVIVAPAGLAVAAFALSAAVVHPVG